MMKPCPHCGKPLRRKFNWWGLGCLGLNMLLFWAGLHFLIWMWGNRP